MTDSLDKETQERIEQFNRKRLEPPPVDPEADRRIREGLEKLSLDLKRGPWAAERASHGKT